KHTFLPEGTAAFHLRKRKAQLELKSGLSHLQQIEAGITGRRIQKPARLADELDDFELVVHHDARRHVTIQENLIRNLLKIDVRRGFCGMFGSFLRLVMRDKLNVNRNPSDLLLIKPVLLIDRLEKIGETDDRLGC